MTAHPAWCDNEHQDGESHRGVVGRTTLGGERISVVITQDPGGWPSVMLSGPVVMAIGEFDGKDMATLFDLAGQPALATLVRLASEVMRTADAAPAGKAG